jgi:phosphate starvation-inducible protein PhoH
MPAPLLDRNDKSKIEKHIQDEKIEIAKRHLVDKAIKNHGLRKGEFELTDTHGQMEMIVTRIGKNSKMIVCGDTFQVDLKNKSDSGFKFLYNAAKRVKNMESVTLLTNNRDEIVEDLINYYNDAYDKKTIVGTAGSSGAQKR